MSISLSADLSMYDSPEYYDHLEMAKRDSSSIITILWNAIDCISACIAIMSIILVLWRNHPMFVIPAFLCSVPSLIADQIFTKKNYTLHIKQLSEERQKYYYSDISSERIFAQNIRVNNIGSWLCKSYLNIWNKLFQERKHLLKVTCVVEVLLRILPELFVLWAMINIGELIYAGVLSVGEFTFFIGLFSQLFMQLSTIIDNGVRLYDNKMKIENIIEFSHAPHTIVSGNRTLDKIHKIEFENVCFRYPDSNFDTLQGISFVIKEGERVALVGINGAGKSTIIKLLLRFYDPQSGNVLINDHNIKEYVLEDLRKNIDCYLQNDINFPFDLRKNIAIKTLNSSQNNVDEQVRQALLFSDGKDVINSVKGDFSKYLSRMFADDGIELSVGQHQKVAIARIFFNRKSFIILDEPSSSLDPESENNIFNAIDEQFKEHTIFFTSHRLTNLFLADRILVLENGKIIESGTRSELLDRKGRFYELYQYQAKKFKGV